MKITCNATAGFRLVHPVGEESPDRECSSSDTDLGVQPTVADCAKQCRNTPGCKFFIYGKLCRAASSEGFGASSWHSLWLKPGSPWHERGLWAPCPEGDKQGRCYYENTTSASCPEGWQDDAYDFYELDDTALIEEPDRNHSSGTSGTWIRDPGTDVGKHDSYQDCTEPQAKCDGNTDLGIVDSGGIVFNKSSLSIPEIGKPTICTNIYRGQHCVITCRNGWYMSGIRGCSCSFDDGACALSGGECVRCPQLDACGGGSSHGDGIWVEKSPENQLNMAAASLERKPSSRTMDVNY